MSICYLLSLPGIFSSYSLISSYLFPSFCIISKLASHLDNDIAAFFESQLGISVNQGETDNLFSLSNDLLSSLEGSYAPSPTTKTRSDSADNSVKSPPVMSQTRANVGNHPLFHSRTPQQRAAMMINPDAPSIRPHNDTESTPQQQPRPTVQQISEEIRRSHSEEAAIGYREVYNIPPAVKYMPVDMITTPAVKKSIARSLLYSALKSGMIVIKHGRQGKPKKRILTCDPNVTVLFWLAENEDKDVESVREAKSISLSDVVEIREGIDIDPETSSGALTAAAANGNISADKLMELVKAKEELKNTDTPTKKTAGGKQNLFESIFGAKEKDGILLGTSTLRKNCKPEDFKLSFSLILSDRTFDIQCLQKADYDTLFINLREILQSGGGGATGSNGHSLYQTWSFNAPSPMNNPLIRKPSLSPKKGGFNTGGFSPKKSVRFLDSGADDKDSSGSFTGSKTIPSASSLTNSMHSVGEYSNANTEVIEMGPDGSNLDLLLQRGNHPSVFSADSYDAYENSAVASQRKMSSLRMSSTEAIQIGIMLSDQEKTYGTNMYESLTKDDEPLVENYVKSGYTTEEAILMVFEDKYVNPGETKVPILPRKESLMNGADSKVMMYLFLLLIFIFLIIIECCCWTSFSFLS
jgi:hypothetical protein